MALRGIENRKRKRGKRAGEEWIKFLGTAGARFVMIKQLRSSGGIWVHAKGTNILIDPGPGSLVKCASSKPKLDPTTLDAVILTHRHLDHSNDINVMIEAMTEGGFKKRGVVFLPSDAIDHESLILKHLQGFPEQIIRLREGESYRVKDVVFSTPLRHMHSVETYGLVFQFEKHSVSFIVDTRYFKGLEECYRSDVIVINTVFFEPRPDIDHLSLGEVAALIKNINPRKVILTHFGMSMVKAKPHEVVQKLSAELGIEVIAAYDGMTFDVATFG